MLKRLADDERSDDQLLKLGRRGDADSFLLLYQRHSGPVFRFALHMSGSREVAEEVVQDIFTALLGEQSSFTAERGSLEAFLIGMARNQVRRQLRILRRDQAQGLETLQVCGIGAYTETDLEILRKAVLALPENYRAVTVLCELEELTYADAALRLGCAVGTVRSRLHRAKALLEAKLRRRNQCPVTLGK